MDREEIEKQLNDFAKANTEESWNRSLELIENRLLDSIEEDERKELEHRLVYVRAALIQMDIHKVSTNPFEEVHLRGKLVKLFKEALKNAEDKETQFEYRLIVIEELKKHKEAMEKAQKSSTKIPISRKVGLFVKDISKTIDVFMQEDDIAQKTRNVVPQTAKGAVSTFALVGGVGLALQEVVGMPFSLSSVVRVSPVLAYICLSSIIRNITGRTEFQDYLYHQSDDYKVLTHCFVDLHQTEIQELDKIAKEKQGKSLEEVIVINERFIEKLDDLAQSTDVNGIRQVFQIQILSSLRESKNCSEEIKNDYLKNKNYDCEKYVENNKKLASINIEIFKRENSLKEEIQSTSKNIVNNTKVMLMAKAILSSIAPEIFGTTEERSLLEPLAFVVANGIIDISTYQNKLKFFETEYEGTIKAKNKRRIEEILENKLNKTAVSYA